MFFVNYNLSRFHISLLSGCPGHLFGLAACYWALRSFQWFFVCCCSIYTFNQTVPFLSGRRFHLDTLSSVGQLGQNKDSCSSAKVVSAPWQHCIPGALSARWHYSLTDSYEFFICLHTNPLSVYIHGKILSKICDLFLHSLFFSLLAVPSLCCCTCVLSLDVATGSCSAAAVLTRHCSDLSCCRAQAPGRAGFRSCGSWPQWLHF